MSNDPFDYRRSGGPPQEKKKSIRQRAREAERAIQEAHKPTLLKNMLSAMNQDEFKFLYSLCWVQEAEGYEDFVPLEEWATPGSDEVRDWETGGSLPWAEHFARAIRYTAHVLHHQLEGISCGDDLQPRKEKMVEGGKNAIYENGLSLNAVAIASLIEPEAGALRTAARFAKQHALPINADVFLDLDEMVHQSMRWVEDDITPEQDEAQQAMWDEALESVHVVNAERLAKKLGDAN